ncbi:MAG TPA: hypothetical protein VD995_20910 [Azospirillum sp.]|nr:hypothetical protein [Azospirillum sp.]
MAIDNIGQIGNIASHSGTLSRTAVATTATGRTGASPLPNGSGGSGDTVTLSKLGQALTGQAAEVFGYLDPKSRKALDDVVANGQASVKDVVLALQGEAKFALFQRTLGETADTSEEADASRQITEQRAAFRNFRQESAGKRREITALTAAFESGAIGGDEALKQIGDRIGEMKGIAAKHGQDGEPGFVGALDHGATVFSSKASRILQAGDGQGGTSIASQEEQDAMSKLGSLGFDATMYRDAFARFAADRT